MPHFFVDISSHGFGHLAQTAPILKSLAALRPDIQFTVRSGLLRDRIASRLGFPFVHIHAASDFGYAMTDPMRVDRVASARLYREAHCRWASRVSDEAAWLSQIKVDFVLANASYLPLAGAQAAGLPAAACCSLNWSDLFDHFFGHEDWAAPIGAEIAAAYRAAPFLALEPAMPMNAPAEQVRLPPVAEIGRNCRGAIDARLPVMRGRRLVLVGFGGIAMARNALPVAAWAERARRQAAGIVWLVPDGWSDRDADCIAVGRTGLNFSDLLATCDAVLTKPGYGTFVEAACAGTPVLWLRREDWPEQACLVAWLEKNLAARELTAVERLAHAIPEALEALWAMPRRPRPRADGAHAAAHWILARWSGQTGADRGVAGGNQMTM